VIWVMKLFRICMYVLKKKKIFFPFVHDTRFPESSTRGIVQDFIETANYGLSFKQHEKSNNQFHPTRNNIFLRWGWVSWDFIFFGCRRASWLLDERKKIPVKLLTLVPRIMGLVFMIVGWKEKISIKLLTLVCIHTRVIVGLVY
jgi:hypothetical protein